MSDQHVTSKSNPDRISVELAARRTGMSLQHTRMSAGRTLMSAIRTSLSLISFGFKGMQSLRPNTPSSSSMPWR